MGRVAVQYDDVWSDVCFESEETGSRQWGFSNVQVTCTELSFPGAMFAKQGGQGIGIQKSIVTGYVCKAGKYPATNCAE